MITIMRIIHLMRMKVITTSSTITKVDLSHLVTYLRYKIIRYEADNYDSIVTR